MAWRWFGTQTNMFFCRHNCLRLLFAMAMVFGFCDLRAQEKGTGPREKTIKMELKSNRKLRLEKREKRRKERAERKAIKAYHKRLQTKKVRRRMKQSRKSAIRYNDNRREFFLKRWWKSRRKRG